MPALVTPLYVLCFAFLAALAAFVLTRNPRAWLHRLFCLASLALLAWVVTLFLFARTSDPERLLLLGRLNFAAIALAVPLGYLFVCALARVRPRHISLILTETLLLTLVTSLTPLVDTSERVVAGTHVTEYGPLFPLYLLHVVSYLAASGLLCFHADAGTRPLLRRQLLFVGIGMLATGGVALTTNALLPYALGDFRLIHVGTLSTILFVGAVAYAIFVHRLFDVRVLIRRTVVYGLLLAFVLAAYSSVALLVTQYLTSATKSGLTQFGVLFIAFSFDPLRRFLEERVDRLLFREGEARRERRSHE